MTSDEIMQVLRLTAMSRVNHPDQQRFCDKLAELFAGWVAPAPERAVPQLTEQQVAMHSGTRTEAFSVEAAAKRGPGRPKKAE